MIVITDVRTAQLFWRILNDEQESNTEEFVSSIHQAVTK